MKRLFLVLLILFIAGILLMMSAFWSFDRGTYVNDSVTVVSKPLSGSVDADFLRKEFDSVSVDGPAYGY